MGTVTNWDLLIQVGILISLLMIFFKLGAVVEVLNHWFYKIEDKQDNIVKELELLRQEKGADYIFMFVVDVVSQTSVMFVRSEVEAEIADIAFKLKTQASSSKTVTIRISITANPFPPIS